MRRTGEQQARFDNMLDRVLLEREKYGDRIRIIATRIYDEYEYATPEDCHHAISKGLSRRGISVKSKPDFVEKSPPGLISTDAVDDQGDIVYLTIDEWKEQYGLPGSGGKPDQNGRINGTFPTEPCFCEDASLFDADKTNATQQTGEAA
jgi:hypothetical protein